jgi:inorganic pyrophosphatase
LCKYSAPFQTFSPQRFLTFLLLQSGKLRYVHDKYPFNYGAHPQTWENPTLKHPDTNANGDNDPLDAVDISSIQHKTGEIIVVKVLGTYAMIDEGETDWKIVCIDVNDPLAAHLNDIEDIDKHFPGKTEQVFTFLRDYKIPDGKPANVFAFNGALQNRAFALKVIEETNEQWHALVSGKVPNQTERYKIATLSTGLNASSTPYTVSQGEAEKHVVDTFLKYLRAKN